MSTSSTLLFGAGLVVGAVPLVVYYLHALFGLGGISFALDVHRARFMWSLAGLVFVVASLGGPVLVGAGVAFVVACGALLQWRAIATRFVPDEEAKESAPPADPNAPVILVSQGNDLPPRAYLLDWVAARHVVRDLAHGVVVTHCPLARSANVFKADPSNRFFASMPYAGHFVLSAWDGPAWSQVTGEVVVGSAKPLEIVPFRLSTWAEAQRLGVTGIVAGDGRTFLPKAADQSCMVAPAGMPVDEPLSVVVATEPPFAIEWTRITSSPEGARVETPEGAVTIRRDPVDGAVLAEMQGKPVATIPVRASVVERILASGRSKLRRA